MEFHEKLQELRKGKGLTQEELAQALYVSRAAVSKWESGRGYPSIDSLKAIASYFSVSIDKLLSCDEVLNIAEEDRRNARTHFTSLVYGLLDAGSLLYLFLPFFAQKSDGVYRTVSLLTLTEIQPYMKGAYFAAVLVMAVLGVLNLLGIWEQQISKISLLWNAIGVMLFIVSPQPYAAAFLFLFLVIKSFLLIKDR